MNTKDINEHQSLRVIHAIVRIYRATSPQSKQIVRDIYHIIAAYELCDKEAALACNHYIITKYPIIYKVAPRYGLHPMSPDEFFGRTESELQHTLYNLCIFLYDRLKKQSIGIKKQEDMPL